MNLCCFKFYRAYSISFNSSNVGKYFWNFIIKRLYQSSGKEKGSCLVFMSSTKHEIGHFHVVVIHVCTVIAKKWTEKSVMHVQRKPKPFAFWCSHCRRRHCCLSSLKTGYKAQSYIVYLTRCTFRRHISWRRWTIKSISQPVWRFNIKRTSLKSSWLALLSALTNKMHCVPLGFCFVRVRCRRIPLCFGSSLRRAFRMVNTICKFPRHCVKLKTNKNMIILSVNHLTKLQVRSLGWCP